MEKCSFEKNNITITQYGGIVNGIDKNFAAKSHYGYRASDIIITTVSDDSNTKNENKLYAPCSIKCVFHDKVSSFGCVVSVFETLEPVKCADGQTRDLTFMFFHGGTENGVTNGPLSSVPKLKKEYSKNDHIYKMGLDGLGTGAHIHLDILNGHITKKGQETLTEIEVKNNTTTFKQPYWENKLVSGFFPNVALNFHEVFYNSTEILFSDRSGADAEWGNDVSFVNLPFDPPANGFYTYFGDTYYYENGKKVTGFKYIAPNYYYFDENGIMQRNKWVFDVSYWYYFGSDGKVIRDNWINDPEGSATWFHSDENGRMQMGWFLDTNNLYYFLNDGRYADALVGEMMRSKWVAANSTDWYYVKESGIMACNETVNIDGKNYQFNQSGKCLNP